MGRWVEGGLAPKYRKKRKATSVHLVQRRVLTRAGACLIRNYTHPHSSKEPEWPAGHSGTASWCIFLWVFSFSEWWAIRSWNQELGASGLFIPREPPWCCLNKYVVRSGACLPALVSSVSSHAIHQCHGPQWHGQSSCSLSLLAACTFPL